MVEHSLHGHCEMHNIYTISACCEAVTKNTRTKNIKIIMNKTQATQTSMSAISFEFL